MRQSPTRNRSSPLIFPLNTLQSSDCELRKMFRQKRPLRLSARCVLVALFMQTKSAGGSTDTELTAVALIPYQRPSWAHDTMLTVVANLRMALRNAS